MLRKGDICCITALAVMSWVLAGCGTSGSSDEMNAPLAPSEEGAEVGGAPSEDSLLRAVAQHVKHINESQDSRRSKLLKKPPYFYKEYGVYLESAEAAEIVMHERETRTSPRMADVRLPKQRFATRLSRKKDEAAADTNFLRDTGVETVTFEWRDGKWVRVGSLFLAEKVEENVNGEWVPLREDIDRAVMAQEEKSGSWLGRKWSAITGRY